MNTGHAQVVGQSFTPLLTRQCFPEPLAELYLLTYAVAASKASLLLT